MQRGNRLLLYIMEGSEAGQVGGGWRARWGLCCFFYLRASQLLPHLPPPPHTDPAGAVVPPPPPNSTTEVTTDPALVLQLPLPGWDWALLCSPFSVEKSRWVCIDCLIKVAFDWFSLNCHVRARRSLFSMQFWHLQPGNLCMHCLALLSYSFLWPHMVVRIQAPA